jgi:hypothetical protein
MTPDELWDKYSQSTDEVMTKENFFDCIKEYGEAVRAEAVKVCNQVTIYEGDDNPEKTCAAAIEKMELP